MRNPLMLSLLFALCACAATQDSKYYTLTTIAPPAAPGLTAANEEIIMGTVTIPELLNRPQIILKRGINEIRILEYDRWAEPMDSMVSRVLLDDLALRKTPVPPTPESSALQKHITLSIDEFDADDTGYVYLSAHWVARVTDSSTEHFFSRTMAADSHNASAIVSAMSTLLGGLADAMTGQP